MTLTEKVTNRAMSRLGRRGSSLLALAMLDIAIAWALFTLDDYSATVRTSYAGQTSFLPLSVWAVVWLVVGVVDAVQAFVHWDDRIAFVLSACVKVAWAAGFLVGWAFFDLKRAWLSIFLYLTLAVLVLIISGWEENHQTVFVLDSDMVDDLEREEHP